MASSQDPKIKHVTVLGAGVIGLTTALKIQRKGGYRVTIVAQDFPTDPKTVTYASLYAGAHHVTVAGDDVRQRDIDIETFKTMWELSAPDGDAPGCFLRLPQKEYHRAETNLDSLKLMPNFTEISKDELVPGSISGITYDSVNTDVPVFLNYLLSKFLASGGSIVRGAVLHIHQLINGGPGAFADPDTYTHYPLPDAIIACPGLGARYLGGIEDKDVYPVRGQTILLRAPWVDFCMSVSGGPSKIWTYVIPRRSGDVIIGGTYEANDWHPRSRPETTLDILNRVLEACPEIAPPAIRAQRKPTVEDIYPLILEEPCGLRPCRKGGVRLETEWLETSFRDRRIPVIHNYGHGGFGFIACFGSASVALKLLDEALSLSLSQ